VKLGSLIRFLEDGDKAKVTLRFRGREMAHQNIGKELLEQAVVFAQQKNWTQLEVTTPPLPEFSRTLQFYRENNFQVVGGRKLKLKLTQ
jgi:hypothetical protein